jgi:hypothetical protein
LAGGEIGREDGSGLETGSGVPHSPQNFMVSGLSARHFGQVMAMAVSLSLLWPGLSISKKVRSGQQRGKRKKGTVLFFLKKPSPSRK